MFRTTSKKHPESGSAICSTLSTGGDAEHQLLATDATMLEISTRCGFSDVKYFTRTFVDWFHLSPADYRRRYQPDTLCDSIFDAVDRPTIDALVQRQRQQVASPATVTL